MLAATAETAHRGHVGVLLPDVYRIMGEIHLEAGALGEAELAFRKALETAEAQKALSLSLRVSRYRTTRSSNAQIAAMRRTCPGALNLRAIYGQFFTARSRAGTRAAGGSG